MPKSQFADPDFLRKAGEVKINPIPVNQYNKTIKEELKEKHFTKDDLKHIYRDMFTIREIRETSQRLAVARLLDEGKPYTAIEQATGASATGFSTTIVSAAGALTTGFSTTGVLRQEAIVSGRASGAATSGFSTTSGSTTCATGAVGVAGATGAANGDSTTGFLATITLTAGASAIVVGRVAGA